MLHNEMTYKDNDVSYFLPINILELPTEVIHMILEELSLKELGILAQVSRQLRNNVYEIIYPIHSLPKRNPRMYAEVGLLEIKYQNLMTDVSRVHQEKLKRQREFVTAVDSISKQAMLSACTGGTTLSIAIVCLVIINKTNDQQATKGVIGSVILLGLFALCCAAIMVYQLRYKNTANQKCVKKIDDELNKNINNVNMVLELFRDHDDDVAQMLDTHSTETLDDQTVAMEAHLVETGQAGLLTGTLGTTFYTSPSSAAAAAMAPDSIELANSLVSASVSRRV